MSTSNIEHKYQDWDKGILRISLQTGRTKRLKWFWDYVIKKKPLFVEIQFYGKNVKSVYEGKVYYTSPIGQFMTLMDDFRVAFIDAKLVSVDRSFIDGDK